MDLKKSNRLIISNGGTIFDIQDINMFLRIGRANPLKNVQSLEERSGKR